MIRSVSETAPATTAAPSTRTAGDTKAAGGFASELAAAEKKTTPKAPKLERTDPVEGHEYAEVVAGPRNGMFVNTSGNERDGKAFLIVEREGRKFHIYGTGADRQVFEVKDPPKKPAATTPAATTPAATTPVAATPAVPTTTTPVAAAPQPPR